MATVDAAQGAGRGDQRSLGMQMRRAMWPYIFISPFFILFAIFGLFPYLYSFYLSFLQWDAISPARWVGLDNYAFLFQDEIFGRAMYNTVWLMLVTLINLAIALVLAFIINSGLVRFKEFWRAAFFLPIVASSVAISIIFVTLFGLNYGVLNFLLGRIGIGPVDWLADPTWIKPAIALVVIWRYFGWNTVIYLAGLTSIPTDLYEAARVDGASWRQIFWNITIPLLKPTITFTIILSIIGGMQLFEEPLLVAGGTASTSPGGTDQAGLTAQVYVYNTAFQYVDFGYAAAQCVALFVVIVAFSFLYYRFIGRDTEAQA